VLTGWGDGAAFPFYSNASSNIRVVGKELGLLVEQIKKVFYSSNEINKFHVHCIGHSLGSHICAYCGQHTKSSIGMFLDRYTLFFQIFNF